MVLQEISVALVFLRIKSIKSILLFTIKYLLNSSSKENNTKLSFHGS